VSRDHVEALGDEIERKTPLLAQVRDEIRTAAVRLDGILAEDWSAGASDEVTLQARAMFVTLIGRGVAPTMGALMNAVGAYHGGLTALTAVIEATESDTSTLASFLPGGHRG
jgi:hypothetical protein